LWGENLYIDESTSITNNHSEGHTVFVNSISSIEFTSLDSNEGTLEASQISGNQCSDGILFKVKIHTVLKVTSVMAYVVTLEDHVLKPFLFRRFNQKNLFRNILRFL